MKEIFHEFGTAIIAILTAVLILGILFGISISGKTGILKIAGVSAEKVEIDYTSYHDFDAVATWHNRTKPVTASTLNVSSLIKLFSDSYCQELPSLLDWRNVRKMALSHANFCLQPKVCRQRERHGYCYVPYGFSIYRSNNKKNKR